MKTRPLPALFGTILLDLVGFGMLMPILPNYAKTFGASGFQVGLLFATYSLVQLLVAPTWGRLSDRVGRAPVLFALAAVDVVGYLVLAFAQALWPLFVARALAGAVGAHIAVAQAYIADVTAAEDRVRGMALIGIGIGIGFTVGPAIAGVAAAVGGTRAPFFVAAALATANCAYIFGVLRWDRPARVSAEAHPRSSRARALGRALATPELGFYLSIFFLAAYAFTNVESTLALFTHAELAFGPKQNAYAFTYVGVVLTLVQALATRRLVARFGELRLIVAGAGAMAFGSLLLPASSAWWHLAFPLTFLALGNALHQPAIMASISRCAPAERQGEILGVAQSVNATARIVGPTVAGFLFDRVGHAAPYLVGAGLMLVVSGAATTRRARALRGSRTSSRTNTPMGR